MKTFFFRLSFLTLFLIPGLLAADELGFDKLDEAIAQKNEFVRQKQARIQEFRKMLREPDLRKRFAINENLYQEYRKFKIDSAIYYVDKNLEIAKKLSDREMQQSALIKLANLYSSTGKFRESEEILKSIPAKALPADLKAQYYEFFSQFYEHYATNSHSQFYIEQVETYRDSLLSVLDPASAKYHINLAQKNIYAGKYEKALTDLSHSLKTATVHDGNYAMYAYLIGDIHALKNNRDAMLRFYITAAITDIQNAIKDNAAIQNIAIVCYQNGNVDKAFEYTQSALEDAIFCNVKFRTLRMSEFYSIINTAYLEKEAESKNRLALYLGIVSVLTILLVTAVIYVYRQMRRVSAIKEQLATNAAELAALNNEIVKTNIELKNSNGNLLEANTVKEEYITKFFEICSAYIDKKESYRKMLFRKLQDKKYDELSNTLKSTVVTDAELEELYRNFDTIFIGLYPEFVNDFNALLNADEQVIPKPGEILNTELRIFALIRLGITDSNKIAAFLRYSLSTIYNYRTKTRNKAATSRSDFENQVSGIGNIQGSA